MHRAEAAGLIAKNLPVTDEPGAAAGLSALAERLGNWAQMLAITNGWLRARVEQGERLTDSIARFERRLAKDHSSSMRGLRASATTQSGFASKRASWISAQPKPNGSLSWPSCPRTKTCR
jgi:hypothetical protein